MSKGYTYRGWDIEFVNPPIPYRGADWQATHPGYDGNGDNRIVHGKSHADVCDEIDAWYEENEPYVGLDCIAKLAIYAIVAVIVIVAIVTGSK